VPEREPLLVAALDRGIPVWSEPELAWRLSGGRTQLVAVTGTNGKTTATEMLSACLGVPAAGNIGAPLVDVLVDPAGPPGLAVAELSSFQLRFADTLRPRVAVLLNLAPDHLDWHGSLEAYGSAKARIWQRQEQRDWAVVGVDDPGARRLGERYPPPGRRASFTLRPPQPGQVGVADGWLLSWLGQEPEPLVATGDLGAPGPQNLANPAAAAAAALCAGASPASLREPLAAYRPGRHRLEHVATIDGVRWVNDSKATNPHAAAAALAAFESVVWIAGGLGKGAAFEDLEKALAGRVRVAITIGSSGPDIAALTRRLGIDTVEAGVLPAAVEAAAARARDGDAVLLAPACASMDQFADYAARGEAFRDAVAALQRGAEVQHGG
jgi:UDP-N-acetylmuramoylalanine--D-glutamate ligase